MNNGCLVKIFSILRSKFSFLLGSGAFSHIFCACYPGGQGHILLGAGMTRESSGSQCTTYTAAADEDYCKGLEDASCAYYPGKTQKEDHSKNVL